MEKFSLYEFMSYFLPGVVAIIYIDKMFPNTLGQSGYIDFINGLIFTTAALIVGLLFHVLTFVLIGYGWFKFIAMRPISKVLQLEFITVKDSVTYLKAQPNNVNKAVGAIFDEGYYYLEFRDKINVAKSFQSFYFFLRNLITLCLFAALVSIVVFCFNSDFTVKLFLMHFSIALILILPLALLALFYRAKMVERVFNTYASALQHKVKD